jgi:hypothetical protein
MKAQFRSTYKTVSAARAFERDEPAPASRPVQLALKPGSLAGFGCIFEPERLVWYCSAAGCRLGCLFLRETA